MTAPGIRPGTVQETLLIPLYGRAVDHARAEPVLGDARAAELVTAIDYDFARFDGVPSLLGAVLRTALFDHWTREFLADHPDGTVVEIGTGLNTRYERVDNGRAAWFELDLPEVMELRAAHFPASPRRTAHAGSVTGPAWARAVAAARPAPDAPLLLSAEAVLPFLPEDEARTTLAMTAARLPGAWLALDTAGPAIVETQDSHDALGKVQARMRWACADPAVLTDWLPGARLLAVHTLTSLPAALVDGLPGWCRETLAGLAAQRLPQVEEYRLTLLRLP
ncbi:class I SAM-dependent methyltransferase [Streptomyces aidingensis]|uniref:O-Methyltransferase involved in polyketide biosynthesis n=1 Tax=Streptomyces aidingensis TaxID=910347 RepID=A0A1I1T4K6_9ACTN|nr:class I SAM-dependent methyltransferase [Streptomyces aidingensis]SFD53519.1 O-Methyltransferase involved in polyketide biosynthesis [Streptomyces aidingensis]